VPKQVWRRTSSVSSADSLNTLLREIAGLWSTSRRARSPAQDLYYGPGARGRRPKLTLTSMAACRTPAAGRRISSPPRQTHAVLDFRRSTSDQDLGVLNPVPAVFFGLHGDRPGLLQLDRAGSVTGRDGVCFVGDQPGASSSNENLESCRNLQSKPVGARGVGHQDQYPWSCIYNKQDLQRELILSPADRTTP